MSVVTSDFLIGLRTQFEAMFKMNFEAAMALEGWPRLVARVGSKGEQNTYNWFGTVPKVEKVTHGVAAIHGLRPDSFTVLNEEWQAIIEVERAAIERDRLDLIGPRISQLAQELARHPGELVYDDLVRANANAFDGAAFFADTRVIGDSANIDNQFAGTGTTVAQFQADLATAQATMRKFQDDRARPMNLVGNVIMVPPELIQVAWQALNANQGSVLSPVVPATQDGILSQVGYLVASNPYLTDANDWYLFHVGPGQDRPFVWQVEKEAEITADTNPNSAEAIKTRKFLYSGYSRYNVAFTDPRYGVKITNT